MIGGILRILLCAACIGMVAMLPACKSKSSKPETAKTEPATAPAAPASPAAPAGPQVSDGAKTTMEFTITLPDKSVAFSNVGKDPFTYVQGKHEIWPSLEMALAGMSPGEKKKVTLTSDQAYGPYDETKKQTVKLAQLPPGAKVGSQVKNKNGDIARVLKITDDSAVIDFNHPLAGKDLMVDVTILKVEK